jgi:hypothetical protein
MEGMMAAFDAIRRISWKILESLAGGGKQDQFVCADCERWESCGLQPSDTCLIKVEQIRRYEQSRWLRNPPVHRWSLTPWDSAF